MGQNKGRVFSTLDIGARVRREAQHVKQQVEYPAKFFVYLHLAFALPNILGSLNINFGLYYTFKVQTKCMA